MTAADQKRPFSLRTTTSAPSPAAPRPHVPASAVSSSLPPTATKPIAKPTTSPVAGASPAPTKAHPAVGPDGKLDKQSLIHQYTPFVRGIVAKIKKTLTKNIEFDDLMSYGMMGLLEAAERYDAKYGANFMTFSYYRIRGAIYDGLRGMGWVSRSEYQKIRFEERATSYLENMAAREMGSTSDHKSVEDHLEELSNQVSQLVTIYVTSLEAMEDLQIEDKEAEAQDTRFADVEMRKYVRQAITMLSDDDRKIIELYYFKELSLQEVGNQLGLSKSWTSRRHAQAVDRLSKILQELAR